MNNLAVGTLEANPETGEFCGTYRLTPREEDISGVSKSRHSTCQIQRGSIPDTFTVEPAGDVFPPRIEILFPAEDVVLEECPGDLTVSDVMGEVDEGSISVLLDGEPVSVEKDNQERWIYDVPGGLPTARIPWLFRLWIWRK